MPLPKLDRAQLIAALNRLGELAQLEGVLLEVALYGGSAIEEILNAQQKP